MLTPRMAALALALTLVVIGTLGDMTGHKGAALAVSAVVLGGFLVWYYGPGSAAH